MTFCWGISFCWSCAMCTYSNRMPRNRHPHTKPTAHPAVTRHTYEISYVLYRSQSAQKSQANIVFTKCECLSTWDDGGRSWAYLLLALRWLWQIRPSSDKIIHLQVIAGPKTRSHTMSGVKNSPASVRMFSSFRIFGWNEIEPTQHFEVYSRMLRLFRISFVVLVGQRWTMGHTRPGTKRCRWEFPKFNHQYTLTTL